MNPLSIGMIRKVMREVSLKESRKIAKKALTMITAKEVHDYLIKEISRIIPFDLSAYIKEIIPTDYRIEK
jgi:signal transduction protein with GAF and PtsI domain